MTEHPPEALRRRDLLGASLLGAAAALLAAPARARAEGATCPTDGTPAQFVPKGAPDPTPRQREFEKYARCPYCGMDRREHHTIRMLVHYADDVCDAVCSIHCLCLSLALNLDRETKEILGPDFASVEVPRPLVDVEALHYLIGADLPHAMTRRSKHGFAAVDGRSAAQARHGGVIGDFEAALEATFQDLFEDVRQHRRLQRERTRRRAPGGGK